jgi:tetratricopeptide (TPR) repeat protein
MPSRIVLLLTLFLVTAAPVFGGLERGNRLYRNGEYAEAVEAYRSALGTRADGPALRYNLGTALLRLGRTRKRRSTCEGPWRASRPRTGAASITTWASVSSRTPGPATTPPRPRPSTTAQWRRIGRRSAWPRPTVDAKWNYELALQERDEQQSAGAGGDEDDRDEEPQEGDDGTGAGSPGDSDRSPMGGAGEHAPMSQEQAERILSAIEQDERDLLQDRLRQGAQERPPARDW